MGMFDVPDAPTGGGPSGLERFLDNNIVLVGALLIDIANTPFSPGPDVTLLALGAWQGTKVVRGAAKFAQTGIIGKSAQQVFGRVKFRGLVQNRNLADLTHADVVKAFSNTPFRLGNHAISRILSPRTAGLGGRTLNDIARLLNKGVITNAGGGDIAIQLGRLEAIVDPTTRVIQTIRPSIVRF
jgi:hypothetical protein